MQDLLILNTKTLSLKSHAFHQRRTITLNSFARLPRFWKKKNPLPSLMKKLKSKILVKGELELIMHLPQAKEQQFKHSPKLIPNLARGFIEALSNFNNDLYFHKIYNLKDQYSHSQDGEILRLRAHFACLFAFLLQHFACLFVFSSSTTSDFFVVMYELRVLIPVHLYYLEFDKFLQVAPLKSNFNINKLSSTNKSSSDQNLINLKA